MCPQNLTWTTLGRNGAIEDEVTQEVTQGTIAPAEIPASLSERVLERWLRFQFNPAGYIDPSYKPILLAPAPTRRERLRLSEAGSNKDDSTPAYSDVMEQLWRTSILSRRIFEVFSLDFSAFPQKDSDLSFFARLAMIDAPDLQRLLFSMGLVLSSGELSLVIDRVSVSRLREGLGDSGYEFASGVATELRPREDWISLQLDATSRARLNERAFHLELGLRLLLLHCKDGLTGGDEEGLDEQILRRLALKCPYSVVSKVERSAEEGLSVGLAVFANSEEEGREEGSDNSNDNSSGVDSSGNRTSRLWLTLADGVIERWHGWLAY